jgi:hypothetical protein
MSDLCRQGSNPGQVTWGFSLKHVSYEYFNFPYQLLFQQTVTYTLKIIRRVVIHPTEKRTKYPSQDSRCLGRHSNQAPTKRKSTDLPLPHPPPWWRLSSNFHYGISADLTQLLHVTTSYFWAEAEFHSSHSVQTDFGAHPASYPMGTGGKATETWSWPLTCINCQGRPCHGSRG